MIIIFVSVFILFWGSLTYLPTIYLHANVVVIVKREVVFFTLKLVSLECASLSFFVCFSFGLLLHT
jgi:hypothetical protein